MLKRPFLQTPFFYFVDIKVQIMCHLIKSHRKSRRFFFLKHTDKYFSLELLRGGAWCWRAVIGPHAVYWELRQINLLTSSCYLQQYLFTWATNTNVTFMKSAFVITDNSAVQIRTTKNGKTPDQWSLHNG